MSAEVNIKSIEDWFKKAVPNPTIRNFNVQLGCHVEEFLEMLETLEVQEGQHDLLLRLKNAAKAFSDAAKKGDIQVGIASLDQRVDFLDSIADQIVTATGMGHMQYMDTNTALDRVDHSNWSKYDAQGNPIFDENGKIKKGPAYHKPDLTDLV